MMGSAELDFILCALFRALVTLSDEFSILLQNLGIKQGDDFRAYLLHFLLSANLNAVRLEPIKVLGDPAANRAIFDLQSVRDI